MVPQKSWIVAMTPSPFYGDTVPLAAVPAVLILFMKPLTHWSEWTKLPVWWSVIVFLALTLIVVLQGQSISGNILRYTLMVLFVVAATKANMGQSSAAQLLGYASAGSCMFYLIFRPTHIYAIEEMSYFPEPKESVRFS